MTELENAAREPVDIMRITVKRMAEQTVN